MSAKVNIAHPMPLRFALAGMGWLPKELGANQKTLLKAPEQALMGAVKCESRMPIGC
jgi:hypothetical protein